MARPWQAMHISGFRRRSRLGSKPGPWGLNRKPRPTEEWQAVQSRSTWQETHDSSDCLAA